MPWDRSGAVIKELIPVWKKIIELSPQLLAAEEGKLKKLILEANPNMGALHPGHRGLCWSSTASW